MFLNHLVEMGGFGLNHHWHGINVLSILECCLLAAVLCSGLALFARYVRKSKKLTVAAIIGSLFFATAAYAANTALSALTASGALAGANLIYVVQTVGSGGVKATMTQVATFIYGLMSGDCTSTSGGAVTCTKINGATPVTSATAGIGITVSPTTGAVVVSAPATRRDNTATTDTITSSDKGTIVTESNASAVAVAITTAGFVSTDYFTVKNLNAGVATYTPSAGTIDGAATLVCLQGQSADLYFDGTNYKKLGSNCQFGAVLGTVTTQSGTTYTLAATDCGTTVRGSNASAITFTIPQGLPVGCNIAIEQALAGQVAVNGSAVTPATLHSAHSFTKTFAQWAIIGIFIESSNVAILTGDGA
jgi:hypothetical protein